MNQKLVSRFKLNIVERAILKKKKINHFDINSFGGAEINLGGPLPWLRRRLRRNAASVMKI